MGSSRQGGVREIFPAKGSPRRKRAILREARASRHGHSQIANVTSYRVTHNESRSDCHDLRRMHGPARHSSFGYGPSLVDRALYLRRAQHDPGRLHGLLSRSDHIQKTGCAAGNYVPVRPASALLLAALVSVALPASATTLDEAVSAAIGHAP